MTGPPFRILLAEKRDDEARRAENIAEAHRDEPRAIAPVDVLYDHLRHAVRRAHDGRRSHRLVGGDHDERVGAVLPREPPEIVPKTLFWIASAGLLSMSGTCSWAAAWVTSCGRCSSKT